MTACLTRISGILLAQPAQADLKEKLSYLEKPQKEICADFLS